MKNWIFCGLVFVAIACEKTGPDKKLYINLEPNTLVVGYSGGQYRISVSSNCNWEIVNAPSEWYSILTTQQYIDIDIDPNTAAVAREATIQLQYNDIQAILTIFQEGMGISHDPLHWEPFPISGLTNSKYTTGKDNCRIYQITGNEIFISPSCASQIYLGHLIDPNLDYNALTTYDEYSYNPIHISAYVNRKLYEKDLLPSFAGMYDIVQQIIMDIPQQNISFSSISPIQYTSYRHLHLLGWSNMGLALDNLINDKPYFEEEMEKATGLIYNYAIKLFNITMDIPERLINESINNTSSETISYINSIAYGKTALMLIESNFNASEVKNTVAKIMQSEPLTPDEQNIKKDLDICYIYFDNHNVPNAIHGGDYLIKQFLEDVNKLEITPLNFSINKLKNNTVNSFQVTFSLK